LEESLKEPHVKEFDLTGRAMKGWVLVEQAQSQNWPACCISGRQTKGGKG